MGRVLKPGPASMEGLRWLARVGPAPLDPWRLAMGWSEVAGRSHARRLEAEGWLARYPMTRGSGSLFVATRTGVRVLGLPLRAAGPPAPTWWAHHCACAWAAAYLDLRGHRYLGARELLDDNAWSGRITWTDAKGMHHAGHRPDLVCVFPDRPGIALEVELAHKSMARLRAIIALHEAWRAARGGGGVLYVCGDQEGADRVRRAAAQLVGPDWRGLGLRTLDKLKERVIELAEQRRIGRVRDAGGASLPSSEAA